MNSPQTAPSRPLAESEIIRQLGEALAAHIRPPIPISVALWSYGDIAVFLGVGATRVAEKYASRADFPRAIRLPSSGPGRAHPRYKAREVIAWADNYLDKA